MARNESRFIQPVRSPSPALFRNQRFSLFPMVQIVYKSNLWYVTPPPWAATTAPSHPNRNPGLS
ncbi:hypothetical protein NITGR_170080 [Nitrospina gracilis 3/211]|uniref:Uncharacterized protein n=1 Tax=Nitrospina gracilis (strain 3/211) TaxID=1266370 RepID=M1YWG0_NITG3|nr:hypothetical protein NITGR_170080 [Nitrospina gracilis 3/211]